MRLLQDRMRADPFSLLEPRVTGVVTAGKVDFDKTRDRLIWNKRLAQARAPTAIVTVCTAEEAAAAVRFAAQHGLGVSPRGGGHNYEASPLRNGGILDGVRIISGKTLELMAHNHLSAAVRINGTLLPAGHGFGLGFAVRTHQGLAPTAGSVGQFFWSGIGGTFFWIDPREDLFAVFMSQGPGQREYTRELVRNLVYAAVE